MYFYFSVGSWMVNLGVEMCFHHLGLIMSPSEAAAYVEANGLRDLPSHPAGKVRIYPSIASRVYHLAGIASRISHVPQSPLNMLGFTFSSSIPRHLRLITESPHFAG